MLKKNKQLILDVEMLQKQFRSLERRIQSLEVSNHLNNPEPDEKLTLRQRFNFWRKTRRKPRKKF